MRWLCIDYGTKRIGLALSDPSGKVAMGAGVFQRAGEEAVRPAVTHICKLAQDNYVNGIVLGYPKLMDNTAGARCRQVEAFRDRLAKKMPPSTSFVLWDERLSTAEILRTTDRTDNTVAHLEESA